MITESARPALIHPGYIDSVIIPLTQGKGAVVNTADYWQEDVAPFLWYAVWQLHQKTFYGARHESITRKTLYFPPFSIAVASRIFKRRQSNHQRKITSSTGHVGVYFGRSHY